MRVTFQNHVWGATTLTTPDALKVPRVTPKARTVFSRGQCHALALAIHEETGWPMIGDLPYDPGHVYVYAPGGFALDASGAIPIGSCGPNGWEYPAYDVDPNEAYAAFGGHYLRPNVTGARHWVPTVLDYLETT